MRKRQFKKNAKKMDDLIGQTSAATYYFVPFCQAPGCTQTKLTAKGYCWRHYQQLRRNGRLLPEKPATPPPCSVPGCPRPAYARKGGYCTTHYSQVRIHGHLLPPRRIVPKQPKRFPRITPAVRRQVLQLRRKGWTQTEIANQVGYCTLTVFRVLKKSGLTGNSQQRRTAKGRR